MYNSHLKWSDHIKHVTAKATRSLNVLRHSLYICLSSVKVAEYKCIVHPILEYASPVWYLSDIKQVESVAGHYYTRDKFISQSVECTTFYTIYQRFHSHNVFPRHSNPSALDTSICTINPYQFSFFINSLFLWNNKDIVQIKDPKWFRVNLVFCIYLFLYYFFVFVFACCSCTLHLSFWGTHCVQAQPFV